MTSQILCEFYSIVTNARRVPNPRTPDDALRAIAVLLLFLHVLPIPARTVEGWMDLLRRHPVTGGDVFDLQIVATMQANRGLIGCSGYTHSTLTTSRCFPNSRFLPRKPP